MGPLLSVRDLRVGYRGSGTSLRQVLQGESLDIQRGETVGLTGRSGSGKTTLASAILRALPPGAIVHGTIEFTGTAMAPVFQEASGALHPMLTVGEQVTEALRARRDPGRAERKKRAAAALEYAGLCPSNYFDAWPHELSGGEKQRALIAQAIAGEPDLLIADEPTASLDSVTQAAIVRLLRDLQLQMGMAVLLITHSPALLGNFATRVLTLRDGITHE